MEAHLKSAKRNKDHQTIPSRQSDRISPLKLGLQVRTGNWRIGFNGNVWLGIVRRLALESNGSYFDTSRVHEHLGSICSAK